jgi:recombination protein RecR
VLPNALDKLAVLLSRLPGIGERSANRLSVFILSQSPDYAEGLGETLRELHEHVSFCNECHMLCEGELCKVCRDPTREHEMLCVVQSVVDLMAFERTGAYNGLYHVMHGVLAPLKGIGPSQLRLDNLELRLDSLGTKEVILATNTDVEGEATALYLARRLERKGVETTRLATGIPMGGELEYIDQNTLARALAGRQGFTLRNVD